MNTAAMFRIYLPARFLVLILAVLINACASTSSLVESTGKSASLALHSGQTVRGELIGATAAEILLLQGDSRSVVPDSSIRRVVIHADVPRPWLWMLPFPLVPSVMILDAATSTGEQRIGIAGLAATAGMFWLFEKMSPSTVFSGLSDTEERFGLLFYARYPDILSLSEVHQLQSSVQMRRITHEPARPVTTLPSPVFELELHDGLTVTGERVTSNAAGTTIRAKHGEILTVPKEHIRDEHPLESWHSARDRWRLIMLDGQRFEAKRLVSLTSDTLTVETLFNTVGLEIRSIQRIEEVNNTSFHESAVNNVLIGAGAGGGLGYVAMPPGSKEGALFFAVVGGAAGYLVGGIFGTLLTGHSVYDLTQFKLQGKRAFVMKLIDIDRQTWNDH